MAIVGNLFVYLSHVNVCVLLLIFHINIVGLWVFVFRFYGILEY